MSSAREENDWLRGFLVSLLASFQVLGSDAADHAAARSGQRLACRDFVIDQACRRVDASS